MTMNEISHGLVSRYLAIISSDHFLQCHALHQVLKGELPPSALNEIGAAYGEPIAAKAKEKTAVAANTGGEEDEEEGDGDRGGSGSGGGRGKCPFMHNTKHDMKPSGSASSGRCPFAG